LFTWVFDGIFQMVRYPVGLYPGWLRLVLTWVVPVGVMTTVPAQALTGDLLSGVLIGASRTDPPLPMARLRGRGQLTELRVADLRFTPDEAAAFLNTCVGLSLSAKDIAALEGRTEGWITGLQLAALSMRGRAAKRVADFVAAFSGSHRHVIDYLIEEVLAQQFDAVSGSHQTRTEEGKAGECVNPPCFSCNRFWGILTGRRVPLS